MHIDMELKTILNKSSNYLHCIGQRENYLDVLAER